MPHSRELVKEKIPTWLIPSSMPTVTLRMLREMEMTRSPTTCPYCDRGPGESCPDDCKNVYRREAGLHRDDGANYLRNFWIRMGAPQAKEIE